MEILARLLVQEKYRTESPLAMGPSGIVRNSVSERAEDERGCVHHEHKKYNPKYPAEAGNKGAAGEVGEALRSPLDLSISDAVESYVAEPGSELAELRPADRQVSSGHYIKHEDMKAWLLSWGTEQELPPPKCACGKSREDAARCR